MGTVQKLTKCLITHTLNFAKEKRWYVHYRVLNPSTGALERKRIYIDKYDDTKLKERFARKLCTKINDKLDQGWNPFIAEKDNRQYTEITKAFDFLMVYKGKFLSKRSKISYDSRVRIFFEYLKVKKMDKMFIFEFSDRNAMDFFDYLLIERKISGVSLQQLSIRFSRVL